MGAPPSPHYDLLRIKQLIDEGRYIITATAFCGAAALGLEEADILECVRSLSELDFKKSMPAEKRPGMWQDVYHPEVDQHTIYLKLQMEADEDEVVVIQFKEK